jgi:Ca2+-binding RTX toxin-like protein
MSPPHQLTSRFVLSRTAIVTIAALLASMFVAFRFAGVPSAFASHTFSTFGEATVTGGYLETVSDAAPGFGGASFQPLPMTFAQLTTLSTDFNVTDDGCGAGSPRFQIRIDKNGDNVGDGNMFVYLGPSPSFNNCPQNTWIPSGNLIGNNDACRWDTSQLAAGTQCSTYNAALAAFGTGKITSISVAIDSGYNATASGGDGEQTVRFDNTTINNSVYTFDPVGNLTIHKYVCPANTTVTRAANAPSSTGSINVPAGCTPQSGVKFGYIHQPDKTDYSPPYLGLNDNTPYTAIGNTSGTGVVTATGLSTVGRHNVAELSSTGAWLSDAGQLGFFCAGTDPGNGTNNYEIAFVPVNGTTHCAAYNVASASSSSSMSSSTASSVLSSSVASSVMSSSVASSVASSVLSSSVASSVPSSVASSTSSSVGSCTPVSAANLIGYWKLDENGGGTAIDSAGGDNNGTHENGPVYTSGTPSISPNPSAVDYDGSNDQTRVLNGSGGAFNFANSNFTVSTFLKTATGDRSVLGNFSNAQRGWGLYVYASNRLNFFGYGTAGINDTSFPATVLDNQWHHVAGVYTRSGSNLTIRTYFDGNLIGTNTANVGSIASNSDLLFGRYLLQPHFDGVLDDIRVYERALTGTEVDQLSDGCPSASSSSASSVGSSVASSVLSSSAASSVTSSALSSSAASSVVSSVQSSVASSVASSAGQNLVCDGQMATIYVKPNGRIYGGTQSGMTFFGSLQGTGGNDVIVGTSGNDSIGGQGGNDRICGRGGNDQIWGDAGSDRIFGGNGADQVDGGTGQDVIVGGGDNDSLGGGDNDDLICGRGGDDLLRGENGDDQLEGNAGNNLLSGGNGNDLCANGSPSSCTLAPIPACAGLSDNN